MDRVRDQTNLLFTVWAKALSVATETGLACIEWCTGRRFGLNSKKIGCLTVALQLHSLT